MGRLFLVLYDYELRYRIVTYVTGLGVAVLEIVCLEWDHLLGKDRTMTPNEMLAHVQATVPSAYIGSTGGNCGAIIVDTPRGEILVTTDSGPWATPDDDDTDRGNLVWFVSLQDGEGTWIDSELERDGDHLVMDDYVPRAVELLARFADWSHRGIIAEGAV